MDVLAIGFAWYEEADYPEIRRIMADGELLPVSYRQWLQKAEYGESEQIKAGHRVVRAVIDPKTFPAWCKARGLNVDSKGRTAFANNEAYRQGRS